MGLFFSKLYEYVIDSFSSDPTRVLMVGLDAAGKTTILYKIKLNETITTIPTIGFNVETVSIGKGVNFTVWDVGGQEKIRTLWRHYYQNSEDQERLDEARDEMMRVLNDDEMTGVPVVVLANKQDLPYAMKAPQLVERLELAWTMESPDKGTLRTPGVAGGVTVTTGGVNAGVLSDPLRNHLRMALQGGLTVNLLLPKATLTKTKTKRLELRSLRSHEWHIQEFCAASGDGLYEGLFRCAEMIKAFRKKRRGGLI